MRLRRSSTPPASAPSRSPAAHAADILDAASTLPQDPRLIVFESMSGRQYSDSPRAISEALQESGIDVTTVWSVRRDATDVPAGIATVVRRSPEWVAALATAHIWVDNQGFARWLPKPDRVHYVQTWHGTPLKQMGWNDPALAGTDADAARELQESYDRWDAIPVPSEYFVDAIVHAFRSRAEVLPFGMPRNDVLVHPLADDDRRRRLAALGLDGDRRIILVAPTRTADPDVSQGRWRAAEALVSADRQVLFRGHYSDVQASAVEASDVRDVSAVSDMADLLAVADVLVTDYSSSMFDFALTDRPIVLFQPDQSAYLDARGAYFDIRDFPPGPIATTTAELVDLVESVDRWAPQWADRRGEYRRRFGTYENGDAAQRVVFEHLVPLLDGR
jgi:CDP-glycerol glycerophosphotransferase